LKVAESVIDLIGSTPMFRLVLPSARATRTLRLERGSAERTKSKLVFRQRLRAVWTWNCTF